VFSKRVSMTYSSVFYKLREKVRLKVVPRAGQLQGDAGQRDSPSKCVTVPMRNSWSVRSYYPWISSVSPRECCDYPEVALFATFSILAFLKSDR
jgi:hypothetical protein